MTPTQLSALLVELLSLPAETEWVEWKHNNDNPDMIAERISALANSAAVHGREFGYLIWGVEDGTKRVVGTTFRPRQSKKGNEELENWLMRSQHPQVSFQIFEWSHQGVPMVLFQIPRASQAPVRFGSEEFIRIGSQTKKLKEYTEKERELWAILSRKPFETGIAKDDVDGPDVLKLCLVTGSRMTNSSMRQRFGIEERNAAKASRIIAEALDANLIKPFDPEQGKKYASYLPFWA